MCTSVFIAALSTVAKMQKQPKCLLVGEWIKKMQYKDMIFVINIFTIEIIKVYNSIEEKYSKSNIPGTQHHHQQLEANIWQVYVSLLQGHFRGDTVYFHQEEHNVCVSPFVERLEVIDDYYLYPLICQRLQDGNSLILSFLVSSSPEMLLQEETFLPDLPYGYLEVMVKHIYGVLISDIFCTYILDNFI